MAFGCSAALLCGMLLGERITFNKQTTKKVEQQISL
jgi:hypothetical protein